MPFSQQKTRYQSEITAFIDDLKKANPQLEQQQLAGRNLLWDKAPVSLEEQRRRIDSSVSIDALTYPSTYRPASVKHA